MNASNYWMSLACLLWLAGQTQRATADTSHVNPLIGTAGHGHTLIDLAHCFKTDTILGGTIRIMDDTFIVGSHRSKGWGEGNEKDWVEHEVFFAARLKAIQP